jgi:hypothetical protein
MLRNCWILAAIDEILDVDHLGNCLIHICESDGLCQAGQANRSHHRLPKKVATHSQLRPTFPAAFERNFAEN